MEGDAKTEGFTKQEVVCVLLVFAPRVATPVDRIGIILLLEAVEDVDDVRDNGVVVTPMHCESMYPGSMTSCLKKGREEGMGGGIGDEPVDPQQVMGVIDELNAGEFEAGDMEAIESTPPCIESGDIASSNLKNEEAVVTTGFKLIPEDAVVEAK